MKDTAHSDMHAHMHAQNNQFSSPHSKKTQVVSRACSHGSTDVHLTIQIIHQHFQTFNVW